MTSVLLDAAAASSTRHLLKRTQLLNGECMCSHTLSTLLTEADQCIFGPRTMMFLTIARFKLWGNSLCLAHTTMQSRPRAQQPHKESVFPSLVWRIRTGLHRASLPDFTNALVTEREQIPAGSSTSGGNPFPPKTGGCYRSRLMLVMLEWHAQQTHMGVIYQCPHTFGQEWVTCIFKGCS